MLSKVINYLGSCNLSKKKKPIANVIRPSVFAWVPQLVFLVAASKTDVASKTESLPLGFLVLPLGFLVLLLGFLVLKSTEKDYFEVPLRESTSFCMSTSFEE